MKELWAYFPKSRLPVVLGWIFLEQGIVAFSTFALIRATSLAGHDPSAAVTWMFYFLAGLSLPYLPGIFARRELENMVQIAYREFLTKSLPTEGGLNIWARRDHRESFTAGITSEAHAQIRQVGHTVFDLCVILLNVTLNLGVLGTQFHPVIGGAFAVGTLMAYGLFRTASPNVDQSAANAQGARTALFAHLQRAWDNGFAAHAIHRRGYRQALGNLLESNRHSQVRAVTTSEVVAVGTTFAILTPVLAAVVALVTLNPSSGFLVALLATLPRQFQIMGNLQVFLSYMTAMTAIRAQSRQVLGAVRVAPVETGTFVRARELRLTRREGDIEAPCGDVSVDALLAGELPKRGRLIVRGPNGAGKSSALIAVHGRRPGAYYLPTHADFWTPEENRTGSTGQRLLRTLEYLSAGELPPVLLLDEWDASLDPDHRARIDGQLQRISQTSLVIEVRHHG